MSERKEVENTAEKLAKIPRGNTCPGVNREIIGFLLLLANETNLDSLLDVPCGEGDFLRAVRDFFPDCETAGADIKEPSKDFPHKFLQIDAQSERLLTITEKFKVITCISGVMEFDNTLAFFEELRQILDKNGSLIVTNDNLVSVRDRILYLLFSRFRQYRLFIEHDRPTWKMLHLQNLLRVLSEAGFDAFEIKYAPIISSEWIWLPFALLIYCFQYLYLRFSEKNTPFEQKQNLYPFRSLLSRHYIVVCRIKN